MDQDKHLDLAVGSSKQSLFGGSTEDSEGKLIESPKPEENPALDAIPQKRNWTDQDTEVRQA